MKPFKLRPVSYSLKQEDPHLPDEGKMWESNWLLVTALHYRCYD